MLLYREFSQAIDALAAITANTSKRISVIASRASRDLGGSSWHSGNSLREHQELSARVPIILRFTDDALGAFSESSLYSANSCRECQDLFARVAIALDNIQELSPRSLGKSRLELTVCRQHHQNTMFASTTTALRVPWLNNHHSTRKQTT